MTKKKNYDYILDGSNVLYENKWWGDEQVETNGVMLDAVNINRLKKAVLYFEEKGYNVLVCIDAYTLFKVRKNLTPSRTSKSQFNKFFKEREEIIIPIDNDFGLIEQKRLNQGSTIITNDSFKSWIQGEDVVEEFGVDDWKAEAKKRQEFGFKEGEFTLARKKYKFTDDEELAMKPNKEKTQTEVPKNPEYLDSIRSRLQSLDARTESHKSKLKHIDSIIQDLSTLVKDLTSPGAKANSSALIPCKFEDEYGQSHLCLLGDNLYILQERKWIEIELDSNTK